MRKIAILNQKGGVGKTTTAVNLSAALARAGQRVCLVDLDPQAHASLHLGAGHADGRAPDERSVYDMLMADAGLDDVLRAAGENLWLAGSHIDLAAVEVELAGVEGRELLLRERLQAAEGRFDYLLIDCPPSLGVLTLNALSAVDEVFIPLQPHFLALHGFGKLLETIALVARRLNRPLQMTGVALCMYEAATRLAGEVSRDVQTFLDQSRSQAAPWSHGQLFQTRVRRNIRLAEAPSFGLSIFDYAPDSPGAADYQQLAGEVLVMSSQVFAAA